MPLVQIKPLEESGVVGWWKIEETESGLLSAFQWNEKELALIHHPQKRIEWLSSRLLCTRLTDSLALPFDGIGKDACNKPFLIGQTGYISFSHSEHYAAAVVHPRRRVGIDLEPIRPQIGRVARRVFSEAELAFADSLEKLTICWCAKEALYKLYGKRELNFKEHLHISFSDENYRGMIQGAEDTIFASLHIETIGEYITVTAVEAITKY